MASEKRQRQRRNLMLKAEQTEKTQQRGRRSKLVIRVVGVAVALVLAAFLYSVFTGNDDEQVTTDGTDSSDSTDSSGRGTGATEEPREDDTSATTSTTFAASSVSCPAEDGSSTATRSFPEAPPLCIDAAQLYAADFETNLGTFTVMLDPALDLISVNNFVFLARYGAFDGTIFHRVISNFVIQGGDVQQQFGTGDPGYRFTGDVPPTGWYSVGAVAMANSGDTSTNGSQFFIVTGENGAQLPPLYSPLGRVTDNLNVVSLIDAVPTGERTSDVGRVSSDVPVEDVVVSSVTIREPGAAEVESYRALAERESG